MHLVSDVTDNFFDFDFDFDFGFEWKWLKKLCVALSFRKEIDDISAGDVSIKYYISSKDLSAIPFILQNAWVLATLTYPNHLPE